MKLSVVVEALLFASHEPLSAKAIVKIIRAAKKEAEADLPDLGKLTEAGVTAAIEELNAEYKKSRRAFTLTEGPMGWRVHTLPDFSDWVRQLFPGRKPERLSPPALETLAIIAYRQPITKADIEAVRGVSVDGVLQTVMDRGLVHIKGRADLPGRPLLYETTDQFLEHFGIRSVEDLPNQAELRRVELPKAEPREEGAGEEEESATTGGSEATVEEQLALAAAGMKAMEGGESEPADPAVTAARVED